MSPTPDTAEPTTSAERDAGHEGMLRELAELGMELARMTTGQAREIVAANPKASLAGVDLQFARIAKAVRMTINLERAIADRREAPTRPNATADAPWEKLGLDKADWQRSERMASRGEHVLEVLDKVIEHADSAFEQDRITAEAFDRFDRGDDEDLLAGDAPIGEIIAHICRLLDFAPDWRKFTAEELCLDPADLAKLRLGRYSALPAARSDSELTPRRAPLPPPQGPPPAWNA